MLLKSKEDGRINIDGRISNIEKPLHNENPWFSLLKETYHKRKQIRIQILTRMFQSPELKVAQGSQAKERTCSCFQKKKKKTPAILALAEAFSAVKCF